MTATLDQPWYALYVRYQSEMQIARLLGENFGFEAVAPGRAVWSVRSGKRVFRKRPLLDTYVFVRANLERADLKKLYGVSGVIDFVRSRTTRAPATIPGEQIEALRHMADSSTPVNEIEYRSRLKENDEVEMVSGPMAGAVGRYIKTDAASGKFVVTLDLFNRALVTDVAATDVRPR